MLPKVAAFYLLILESTGFQHPVLSLSDSASPFFDLTPSLCPYSNQIVSCHTFQWFLSFVYRTFSSPFSGFKKPEQFFPESKMEEPECQYHRKGWDQSQDKIRARNNTWALLCVTEKEKQKRIKEELLHLFRTSVTHGRCARRKSCLNTEHYQFFFSCGH